MWSIIIIWTTITFSWNSIFSTKRELSFFRPWSSCFSSNIYFNYNILKWTRFSTHYVTCAGFTNNNGPAISSLQVKLVCCEPYRFLERVYHRHLHRYSSVWWWHWCHQEMARPPVHPACQHRLTSGRSTGQVWDQWQGQWQILPVVKCFILSIDSATYSSLLAN